MRAVYAEFPSTDDPLAGLRVGSRPAPESPRPGWSVIEVRAAALNHHDLWTLRGAGLPADRYPMILGCDAVGVAADGTEVLVHGVVAAPEWSHDPVRDPGHTVLSEGFPGTFGECVAVPDTTLHPKPQGFTDREAACLPATWLTAYRMLFTKSGLRAGDTVLIQGAGGGLAVALIRLAAKAGLRVWVTSRTEAKCEAALTLGAHAAFPVGAPLPDPVDAVMESVGLATWSHSIRSVRPGGTIVVTGATTGGNPPAFLNRLFWQELRVVGSTSGTPQELQSLIRFMRHHDLKPVIAAELPFEHALEGFRRMERGDLLGKIVFYWGRA